MDLLMSWASALGYRTVRRDSATEAVHTPSSSATRASPMQCQRWRGIFAQAALRNQTKLRRNCCQIRSPFGCLRESKCERGAET